MIRVTLFRNSAQEYTGYELSGHADYAEEGSDIICSAASVLAINTTNSIEAFTEDRVKAEEREDGGYLKVDVQEPVSQQSQLLLKSLALGLKMIEDTYGREFIRVKEITPDPIY